MGTSFCYVTVTLKFQENIKTSVFLIKIYFSTLRMRFARRETGNKPSSKIFYRPFQGGTSFVNLLCFSVLWLLRLFVRLFICALWSPAGKGLTSWLSFLAFNCEFVTFPSVYWVRCDT